MKKYKPLIYGFIIILLMLLVFTTSNPVSFVGNNNLSVSIVSPLESSGAFPVTIQDQTTPTVIVPLSEVTATTSILHNTSINGITINITNTTNFIDGAFITIADPINNRYYIAHQLGAPSGNTIVVDTPLDFVFSNGTQITAGSTNLAVNGATTTRIFSLRAGDSPVGVPLVVDVTRIMFKCLTSDVVTLSKFGDIVGGLTNGIVLRRVDGLHNNIFNVHTNGGLASLMYDFNIYEAINPAQDEDGFLGRLTFAGSNKMGVTIRIGPEEDLEILIQDDLSSLLDFEIIVEGHIVTD